MVLKPTPESPGVIAESHADEPIPGGYCLTAHKVDVSEIAHAAPCTRESWFLFIRRASFRDHMVGHVNVHRGQWLTSYAVIQDALYWTVGCRRVTYTRAQIEAATKWLRSRGMVTTSKTRDGFIVTVCNYGVYQDPTRYECHTGDGDGDHDDATLYSRSKKGKNKKKGLRHFFPKIDEDTCVVSDHAKLLLSTDEGSLRHDPKCIRCRRSGVPARVSANDENILYYICRGCCDRDAP